jgi:NADH-quinone oxidoreductase subunit E
VARLTPETLAQARRIIGLYPEARSALIPLCHLAQAQDGWLTPEAIEDIAALLDLTPADVYGTASFYDMLHVEPVGRYLVGVCTNLACLLEGGEELLEHAATRLGVHPGGTSADGRFTLEEVECVAACDRAPCATVNWRYFGPLSAEAFDALIDDLVAGRRDDDVPPHGVLSRVPRRRGLSLAPDELAAERARADAARAAREAAAQAAKETQS